MTLENFVEQRKFEMMRNLHNTSAIFGFRNYLMNKQDRQLIHEISCDMPGNLEENDAYNIFCLGFYRGRMYEKERSIEKAPEQLQLSKGANKTENGLT